MTKRKTTKAATKKVPPQAQEFVEAKPVQTPGSPRLSMGFLSDEQASVLNDYIRLYVGAAAPFPTDGSGVYMNRDRILLTQWYLDMAGYDLYDEVERDPQIAGVMMTRKLAVAGLSWRIKPSDEDDERSIEMAKQIEQRIRRIPSFFQDMVQLMDCVGKGFAWSEIIWGIDDDGWVVPFELLNRPQRRLQFDATTRWPKIRTQSNPFYGEPIEDKKHIIHRNAQLHESPFGDPIDQKIYWMWLFKRNVIKFWMQHAESTSSPIPLVKYPADITGEIKTEAMAVAKKIRVGSYGAYPENFSVEFAKADGSKSTGDTFEAFVRFADEQIAKSILGQTLTTEGSGSNGAGSRALGVVHNTVRQDIIEYDARALADTLTHTLVRWMCEFNFVGIRDIPHFEFILDEAADVVALSSAVANLTSAGKIVADEYIENVLGIQLDHEAMEEKKVNAAKLTTQLSGAKPDKEDDDATKGKPKIKQLEE